MSDRLSRQWPAIGIALFGAVQLLIGNHAEALWMLLLAVLVTLIDISETLTEIKKQKQ